MVIQAMRPRAAMRPVRRDIRERTFSIAGVFVKIQGVAQHTKIVLKRGALNFFMELTASCISIVKVSHGQNKNFTSRFP